MGDGQELPEDFPKKPKMLCSGKEPFFVEEPSKLKHLRMLDRRYYGLGFRIHGKKVDTVHIKCSVCGRFACRKEGHVSV